MKVYNQPLYYEIAFGFVDAKRQVDVIEKFIKRYSGVRVRRVLDLCCGPSFQLRELVARGYEGIGLDNSSQMLCYLQKKVAETGNTVRTVKVDMRNFILSRKTDFAFIMMGSLSFRNRAEYVAHFNSVASSLKRGGLYLIENFWFDIGSRKTYRERWSAMRDGIKVIACWTSEYKNAGAQVRQDAVTLKVKDDNRRFVLQDTGFHFPLSMEEFLALMKESGKFQVIGVFERNKMKRVKRSHKENWVLLRRK